MLRHRTDWMTTARSFVCLGVLVASAGACSAAPPTPAEPAGEPTATPAGKPTMLVTHQEGSGTDEAAGADRDADSPKPAPPDDVDYNVTYQDCRALARVYGGAWLSAELEKLNAKKLKQAQFAKVEGKIRQQADETREQWMGQCEGIIDTPYPFSRLKCALKARTVKRFDDCWDGKTE